MTKNPKQTPIPTPPAVKENGWAKKVEVALEVRRSSAAQKKGKPVAFPTRRARP